MSLPRNTPNPVPPPYPSSPSKSSSRRVSGGGINQQQPIATRSLLPSPHFQESITSGSLEEPSQGLGDLQQDTPLQPPRPSFQPFFTLIEDSLTHEHFHPTVHYIFADDDADIITEAALRSLEQSQPVPEDSATSSTHQPRAPREETEHAESNPDERYLPQTRTGVKNHYLVLDVAPPKSTATIPTTTSSHQNPSLAIPATAASLNPEASTSVNISAGSSAFTSSTGYEVINAYSMSADWQVLRTGITAAPTWGGGEGTDADIAGDGLMLRVEGRGRVAATAEGLEAVGDGSRESVQEMIERFERALEEVKVMMTVGMGVGGGRQTEGEVEGGAGQGDS